MKPLLTCYMEEFILKSSTKFSSLFSRKHYPFFKYATSTINLSDYSILSSYFAAWHGPKSKSIVQTLDHSKPCHISLISTGLNLLNMLVWCHQLFQLSFCGQIMSPSPHKEKKGVSYATLTENRPHLTLTTKYPLPPPHIFISRSEGNLRQGSTCTTIYKINIKNINQIHETKHTYCKPSLNQLQLRKKKSIF